MSVIDVFKSKFNTDFEPNSDFSLIECENGIMMGLDKKSNLCVVVIAGNQTKSPLIHRTKLISIECNIYVSYQLNGENKEGKVHIIRCLSNSEKERELFLELAIILVSESDNSEESTINTFTILRSFFNNNSSISDNQLIGLYAELYTICKFHDSLAIEKFWQSRDRMKFDFSFSEKVKLEVKATTQNHRVHHFRHEQLMTDVYKIYVLSYMLRYDDEGLSLFDLILNCKNIISGHSDKIVRLNLVIKNAGEERLKELRFNTDYTELNRHFYSAESIPRFSENTPNGVSNAEYDCYFDNVSFVEDNDFVSVVRRILSEREE